MGEETTPNVALVTGAAGFIGYHLCEALIAKGVDVIGVDNLNAYYDPTLKQARLARLARHEAFAFHQVDIAQPEALRAVPRLDAVEVVAHLAAQAGVRYSIEHPFSYVEANVVGHLSILEMVRGHRRRPRLVYASSSSVYGANEKRPFAETDPVDHPVSLYAATKRASELISESYARLYGIEQIGLRFFTVYGRYGRPDMAYWLFTDAILNGRPIELFNNGNVERDFTHIDDIIAGVMATIVRPPHFNGAAPHRVYNIGDNKPRSLSLLVDLIEAATGKKAMRSLGPAQPGDVAATWADISAIAADYGYAPRVDLDAGIADFVAWFRDYHA